MNNRHILFDLDGTLTDPGLGIINSVQYALQKLGREEIGLESLRSFVGPPLQVSFKELGLSDEQVERAVGYYREYFTDRGMYENEVYEGIPALLEGLTSKGFRLHVATSKPEVFARRILEHFSLNGYFDTIVGSELNGTRTDKGEVIAKVLEGLSGVTVEECVMIGDRKHDVIGAQGHGMATVGVLFGYGSTQELTAAGSTYLVRTVAELKELLTA